MNLWLAALLLSLWTAAPGRALAPRSTCQDAPVGHIVESIGPGRGQHPAWMVDGTTGWTSATHPVKTVWVVAQPASRVRISGRHLDVRSAVTLQRGGGPVSDAIVIDDPRLASVKPGGASADELANYAFVTSHVFYAAPGCYEFDVEVDGTVTHIVREIM